MTSHKRTWVISQSKVLTFKLFLNVEMFYGSTGHKTFLLQIGKVGTPISKFHKVSGWIEELLADTFEKIDFNPARFKYSSTFYPDLVEAISQHDSEEPLIIPFILEFRNSKTSQIIGEVESLAQKKGMTIHKK